MSFDQPYEQPFYEKEYETWSMNRKWAMEAAEKLFAHIYGENAKHGGLYEWADIIQYSYDKYKSNIKEQQHDQP